MANYKVSADRAARTRLAKRARRQKAWRENRNRVLLIVLVFILVVTVGFLTPIGPNWYRARINERMLEGPGAIAPGAIRDLYRLGAFYDMSFRPESAMKCFDDIGIWYFGFKLNDYATNPERSFEQRRQALVQINKGNSEGPPYEVPPSEIQYVGLAIWRLGRILETQASTQFIARLYVDLYQKEIQAKHPASTDPDVNDFVSRYLASIGRRSAEEVE